ncbi:MAG: hypothetical protein IKK94_05920 [Clostridia bacterium]|nr:hypothetical protein [Clostridia bacterium]
MNKVFNVIDKICLTVELILIAWVFISFIDVACHNLEPGLELWLGNANLVKMIFGRDL